MADVDSTAPMAPIGHNEPMAYVDSNGIAVYRASSVSRCLSALVASRLGFDAMDPPASMQLRFDDGHLHEPSILAKVAAEGWELYGEQMEVEVEVGTGIIIRGHLDCLATHPVHGIAVVEAKALAQSSYEKWLKERWLAFPAYADQVTVYMTATQAQLVVMAVKNKNSGQVDISLHFEPPASIARIKARVAKAENQARKGELPAACDKVDYPCPYYYLHPDPPEKDAAGQLDDLVNAAPVSAELVDALAGYGKGKQMELDGKKVQKEWREKLVELFPEGSAPRVGGGFRGVWGSQTRSGWDWDKLRDDLAAAGFDLDAYATQTVQPTLTVKAVDQ